MKNPLDLVKSFVLLEKSSRPKKDQAASDLKKALSTWLSTMSPPSSSAVILPFAKTLTAAGLVDCGKSRSLRAALGLANILSGRVELNGNDLLANSTE